MDVENLVSSWMFMQSPIYIVGILIFYWYFVLKLGPRFMKNRPPFQLRTVLMIYNGCQVLFSLWLSYVVIKVDNAFEIMMNCKPVDPELIKIAAPYGWLYVVGKMVELLDTVFFVLRKKHEQVTFLHVYHHTVVLGFSWVYLKYQVDNGQGIFIALVNSLVHVIMYSYYFISGLGPKYQKYLWWKKYMTAIQLIQFFIIIVYIGYLIVTNCNISKPLVYFYVFNDVLFLYLFADFYIKSYKKQRAVKKDTKK